MAFSSCVNDRNRLFSSLVIVVTALHNKSFCCHLQLLSLSSSLFVVNDLTTRYVLFGAIKSCLETRLENWLLSVINASCYRFFFHSFYHQLPIRRCCRHRSHGRLYESVSSVRRFAALLRKSRGRHPDNTATMPLSVPRSTLKMDERTER